MRKVLIILIASLVFSAHGIAENSLIGVLSTALNEISESHQPNIIAAFGNFTYEYSEIGSSFSRFIEDALMSAVTQTPRIQIVILDALENLDPAFKDVYGEVFSARQVGAIIRGRFFDRGSYVLLILEVISLQDGTLIGKKDLLIAKNLIPMAIAIPPGDYEQAQKTRAELAKVVDADSGGFVVQASTDRGSGAVYREGEKMTIRFFANRDAYVKIYHIDVNGITQLIFPNAYWKDNFIRGSVVAEIPDSKVYPFEFVMTPPFGTEHIKVIASTVPFSDIEDSFADLGRATKRLVTRGLKVGGKAAATETLLSYAIVKE